MIAMMVMMAGAASAGVYDDAVVWWHLDYAPNYVEGGLNQIQPGELRNQSDWGATSGIGLPPLITGDNGGGPVWTNAPVDCPIGGRRYGGVAAWFRQLEPATTPDTIRLTNLVAGVAGASATLVTRIYWDGQFYQDDLAWIFNHSLDWNGGKGWIFGIKGSSLYMYMGSTSKTGPAIQSGKWYDIAFVLTDNGDSDVVEFYSFPHNDKLAYRRETSVALVEADRILGVVGSEASTGGSRGKAFGGMMDHFAFWNRALSRDEVMEALCFPQPLLQVGLENGSALDLGPAGTTTAVFRPGDAWHTMPRSITSERGVTFEMPITNVMTSCNYVFHVKAAECVDGNSAKLLLRVNGQANTARDALRIGSGGSVFWPVAKDRLLNGTNTFELTVAGGPATEVVFDWLSLEGGWQVGYDNNSKDEFSPENGAPDDFYVTDKNWKNMEAALARHSSMETNTVLHFALSPELAGKTGIGFTYTTRIIQQSHGTSEASPPPEPPYPFSIHLNGTTILKSDGVANGTLVPLTIPSGLLRAGMNNINLTLDTDTMANWIQFDFHRFEPVMWELPDLSGTILEIR